MNKFGLNEVIKRLNQTLTGQIQDFRRRGCQPSGEGGHQHTN